MSANEQASFDHRQDERALVLEGKGHLSIRNFPIADTLGDDDVRVAVHTVGICGSDVHYFMHGGIGSFIVREPMILGHEASGVVSEVGRHVTHLKVGDRVCMEPGVPTPASLETRAGQYNLDPAVRFWATPPINGVLRRSVIHPADFTFKLPDEVSFAEGAMVEPLAVGVSALNKARPSFGSVAVVIGAGTIGLLTALAALAGGCSRVIISDVDAYKLGVAGTLGPITTVNVAEQSLDRAVALATDARGADVVFECSGNAEAAAGALGLVRPGGVVVFIGMPATPIAFDVVAAQAKEVRIENVFRYAGVFGRCVAMMASGRIDVKPLITRTVSFEESIGAFELASRPGNGEIKIQIEMGR